MSVPVWSISAALLILATGSALSAQTAAPPLKRLSLEQLMEVDVTSVSRRPEPFSGAAAAIQILTHEDLRRAGVTDIIEALRLAAGIFVARQNGSQATVSARGFTSLASNKLLVLIDGRSVYTPLFSGVFWDVQDVVLGDVDRIEVIRGPGAALWGSNAVNGVIHVITRPASETKGTVASLAAGNEDLTVASLRYGDTLGRSGAYRIYGKYGYIDRQRLPNGDDANDRQRHGQGGMRADWTPTPRRTFTVQGDLYTGRFGRAVADPTEASGGNLIGRWRETLEAGSDIELQTYYDRSHRLMPGQLEEHRQTWDVELQHRVRLGRRHEVLWGGGYRFTSDDTEDVPIRFDPGERSTSLWSAFVQDEISVRPGRLWVVTGARVEHNDYSGFEAQPTVRVRFTPDARQTVWAALSRAVRIPTRFDADLRLGFPGAPPLLFGNPDFDAENAVSGELGYRARPHPAVALDVATYLTRYTDLRSIERVGTMQFPVRWGNRLDGRVAGGEIVVRIQPVLRARFDVAYNYLTKSLRLEPESTDPTGGGGEGNDPRHHGLLRWSFDLAPDWQFDGALRAVSALPNPRVPAYADANLRLAWQATPHVELSLIGRDLLGGRHPEFGAEDNRVEIERSIYVRAIARF